MSDVRNNKDYGLSPYAMFQFTIRTETTRRYYERRIKRFFHYIGFGTDQEFKQRFDSFAKTAYSDADWPLDKIITFLQFQKERTESAEITGATLSNFVKALKALCEASDVTIPWKKISRGLPKRSQSANGRAPTILEINKYSLNTLKEPIFILRTLKYSAKEKWMNPMFFSTKE